MTTQKVHPAFKVIANALRLCFADADDKRIALAAQHIAARLIMTEHIHGYVDHRTDMPCAAENPTPIDIDYKVTINETKRPIQIDIVSTHQIMDPLPVPPPGTPVFCGRASIGDKTYQCDWPECGCKVPTF